MNKTSYIICAEGGCSGHFIACLIRSMWDANFFANNSIPSNGSCDTISHAGCLHVDYALVERKVDVYPERDEAMLVLLDAVKSPETTHGKFLNDYFQQYDYINVLHYWQKNNLKKFLEIPYVKIIHVRADREDYKQIAINKITKNITNDIDYSEIGMDVVRFNLNRLLNWADITDNITEIDNIDSMKDLPMNVRLDLLKAWEKLVEHCSTKYDLPDPDPKLLILKFGDIMNNKELVMSELAKFTNSKIDESTKKMYNDYLSKQPTMESI